MFAIAVSTAPSQMKLMRHWFVPIWDYLYLKSMSHQEIAFNKNVIFCITTNDAQLHFLVDY